MSKPEQKESEEVFQKVENSLFHIHSMTDILKDIGLKEDINNGISNPIMSIAEIIKEKAEYCLRSIDEQGVTR
jgi:hypothetical protein